MEGLSSMNNLQLKLLIIGVALLAVVLSLHFNFGSFVSDLYLSTQRKGAAIPADPTCPKGRYSKKTGGVCSGPSLDDYDYSKDPPETAIGATGERYNVGSYDSNPNRKDDVDYRKSDVLKRPASITYSDWALDSRTNRDINTKSRVSNSQFRGENDVVEDEDDLPRGRSRKDVYDYKYDTGLLSGRNRRNSGYDEEYDTDKKFKDAKKNRPSVDELIKASSRKNIDISKNKKKSDDEDDYLNNRLSRDYKSRERQFELPYEKTYNKESTAAYNSGSTCNNQSYDEAEDEDCCEGFSPFK
jgi:hypothetical protein